jgi:hypothetical protein
MVRNKQAIKEYCYDVEMLQVDNDDKNEQTTCDDSQTMKESEGDHSTPRSLTTTQTKDEVEGRLLLDVVIRKSAAILELLASEDETLLVGRDTLLILNLRLDIVNRVGRLDLEGDGLAGQRLDEDLHTTTETKDKVKRRLLLDVVIRKGATVLELLAGKDETLLVWRDAVKRNRQ